MESVSGMGFCLGFIALPRIWILVFMDDGLCVSNGCCFGRWVMPEETANLRKSRNASRMPFGHALSSRLKPLDNRSPIHPRLAPLKSRGAGGLLFEVGLVGGFFQRAFALKTQRTHRFPADYTQIRFADGRRDTATFSISNL